MVSVVFDVVAAVVVDGNFVVVVVVVVVDDVESGTVVVLDATVVVEFISRAAFSIVSQKNPVKPFGHTHVKPEQVLIHVPPLLQTSAMGHVLSHFVGALTFTVSFLSIVLIIFAREGNFILERMASVLLSAAVLSSRFSLDSLPFTRVAADDTFCFGPPFACLRSASGLVLFVGLTKSAASGKGVGKTFGTTGSEVLLLSTTIVVRWLEFRTL